MEATAIATDKLLHLLNIETATRAATGSGGEDRKAIGKIHRQRFSVITATTTEACFGQEQMKLDLNS